MPTAFLSTDRNNFLSDSLKQQTGLPFGCLLPFQPPTTVKLPPSVMNKPSSDVVHLY